MPLILLQTSKDVQPLGLSTRRRALSQMEGSGVGMSGGGRSVGGTSSFLVFGAKVVDVDWGG